MDMEHQMREFNTVLSYEYEDMLIRFKKLRNTLDTELPEKLPENRPPSTSKCRERLIEAQRFSEKNYAE